MLNKNFYKFNKERSFTLIELITVVIILGIVAALAIPQHFRIREKTVDKQALVALELIRSAERQHWMKLGYYFPTGSPVGDIDDINSNLSLDLVEDKWGYCITNNDGFTAYATRIGTSGYARTWQLNSTMYNATCSGKCP